jgi:bile acid:Na+ symporter, BASS family
MAALALLSMVTIPVTVELLQRVFARPAGAAPGAVGRILLMSTLLPLTAGMAVRAILPALAERIERPVTLIAKVLLPLAIVALLAGSWRAIWAAIGDGTVVAIAGFVAAGLLAGHVLGGPNPEQSVVLALSTASRHPALAFSMASANFPGERFGGTILLYLIVNALVALPYIAWARRQRAAAIASA